MIRLTGTWTYIYGPNSQQDDPYALDYGKWISYLSKRPLLKVVSVLDRLVDLGSIDGAKYMPSWKHRGKHVLIVYCSFSDRDRVKDALGGMGVTEVEWKTNLESFQDKMARSPELRAEINEFMRSIRDRGDSNVGHD